MTAVSRWRPQFTIGRVMAAVAVSAAYCALWRAFDDPAAALVVLAAGAFFWIPFAVLFVMVAAVARESRGRHDPPGRTRGGPPSGA